MSWKICFSLSEKLQICENFVRKLREGGGRTKKVQLRKA